MTTMKLRKSIQAHGELLGELSFREPVGHDLVKSGMPMFTDQAGNKRTDPEAITRLIANLTEIPPSSVGTMSLPDFIEATGIVVGFFADATPSS